MSLNLKNIRINRSVKKHHELYEYLFKSAQLGEVIYDCDLDKYYMVVENGLMELTPDVLEQMDETIDSMPKVEGGVSMTMYEINQGIISQLPTHDKEKIKEDIQVINKFEKKHKTKYYMLLCKEISYFTVLIKELTSNETLGEVIIDCIKSVGEIKDIDDSDSSCLDIWVTTESKETHCIHLFDYQHGIVEFGG